MNICILTIFPDIFTSFNSQSLVNKALQSSKVSIDIINIRDFASAPHYQVDDSPYGGGAGMVMKPEPLTKAAEFAKQRYPKAKVLLMTPSGNVFNQSLAKEFSHLDEIILVCGRYEGVDQRFIDLMVDHEISIGDYILMGGEVPAMVVIEAVIRLRESVIGNSESISEESFNTSLDGIPLLEAPHYTRPQEFRGITVPEVLLSGDHKLIRKWRNDSSLERTKIKRPDLIKEKSL